MKKKNLNDFIKRHIFKQQELKRICFKLNLRSNSELKINSIIQLEQITKNSLLGRIKNRCAITGRAKAIYSKLGLSRIKFREAFFSGFLVGLKKY